MKKVAVIGSGAVGKTLAKGFLKHGYDTTIASRSEEKRKALAAEIGGNIKTASFADAAKSADIIVLAVKGHAAKNAITEIGIDNLKNKTVIDTGNPIADLAPVNGVLQYSSNLNKSLMEELQEICPDAHFVKGFSCVGSAFMVEPDFGGTKPSMFICGNNEQAKVEVKEILTKFGWEIEDMGMVEAARAIEPLAMLWCIPGMREGKWSHAFKLLKK
ncbi:MAG: NAD(P)-binding domain-containing protein [Sphingobacteriaceae bacterium]|nr:NAD(P)-binding domain-containing protein [Sphingobacteriaceae bacterium]